jgi:ferredoxin-NADP reductase
MARTALPRRLTWQLATVVDRSEETPRCKTIVFDVPEWTGHQAGQHVDVRLTAEDGYQAQRSYSIASAPGDKGLALTVERLKDGEVSPYLVDELRPGDQIELRGPIGGYFVWEASLGGPLVLVAGGSGVVPLRAILRHRASEADGVPAHLLYSSRTLVDVIYREELLRLGERDGLDVQLALTREWPGDWAGRRGRIDRDLLADTVPAPAEEPLAYICGPNSFVESIAETLVALGHRPQRIRTERFGPTGT